MDISQINPNTITNRVVNAKASDNLALTVFKIVAVAIIALFAVSQILAGVSLVPIILIAGTGALIVLSGDRIFTFFANNAPVFVPSNTNWRPRHTVVVASPTTSTVFNNRNPAANRVHFSVPGHTSEDFGSGHSIPVVPVQRANPPPPAQPTIVSTPVVQVLSQKPQSNNPAAKQVQFNIPGETPVGFGGGSTIPIVPVQQTPPPPAFAVPAFLQWDTNNTATVPPNAPMQQQQQWPQEKQSFGSRAPSQH